MNRRNYYARLFFFRIHNFQIQYTLKWTCDEHIHKGLSHSVQKRRIAHNPRGKSARCFSSSSWGCLKCSMVQWMG